MANATMDANGAKRRLVCRGMDCRCSLPVDRDSRSRSIRGGALCLQANGATSSGYNRRGVQTLGAGAGNLEQHQCVAAMAMACVGSVPVAVDAARSNLPAVVVSKL